LLAFGFYYFPQDQDTEFSVNMGGKITSAFESDSGMPIIPVPGLGSKHTTISLPGSH
jgi:hypothetical protein